MSKTKLKIGKLHKKECDSILKFLFREHKDTKNGENNEDYVEKYIESQEKWRLAFECIHNIDTGASVGNYLCELLDNISHIVPDLNIAVVIYENAIGKNKVYSKNKERLKYLIDSVFPSLNMYNAHIETAKYFENKGGAHPNYRIMQLESGGAELGYVYFESDRAYEENDLGHLESVCKHIITAMKTIGLYEGIKKENDTKLEYAASFSHEIKTPLNGIIGYAELLKQNLDKLPDELKEYAENIWISSHQLKCLLVDIIENTKLRCGKIVVRKESFETKTAVENVFKIFGAMIKEKNITISPVLMQVSIISDHTKFNQILYNLISNAIKFSPANSSIDVTSWVQEDKYYFEIKNKGVGISKEEAKEIFNFLHKTNQDAKLNPEGSGIGLCVAKQLTDALSGTLEFESTKNETVFMLTLPA